MNGQLACEYDLASKQKAGTKWATTMNANSQSPIN